MKHAIAIRDGPTKRQFVFWYGVEDLKSRRSRPMAAPTCVQGLDPCGLRDREVFVKDSGYRETEIGTMVRAIPALAGRRECGFRTNSRIRSLGRPNKAK